MAYNRGELSTGLAVGNAHSALSPVDIYTRHTKVAGNLSKGQLRVSDVFNQVDSPIVILESTTVTPLSGERPPVQVSEAQIIRASVIIVVPREQRPSEPAPVADERSALHVNKDRHRVVIEASPFTVSGYIHLIRETKVRDLLLSVPSQFIPVTDATITVHGSEEPIKADAAIINRSFIEVLYMESGPTIQAQPAQPAQSAQTPQPSKLIFRRV